MFQGLDGLLQFDALRAQVVTEPLLLVEGRRRLLELAVQPRQLFLLRLPTRRGNQHS